MTTTRLNPNRDTRKVDVFTTGAGSDFVAQLEQTLDKANYERVTQEVISAAMEESSLFKLKIDINIMTSMRPSCLRVAKGSVRNSFLMVQMVEKDIPFQQL